jgi:hypothetical protein
MLRLFTSAVRAASLSRSFTKYVKSPAAPINHKHNEFRPTSDPPKAKWSETELGMAYSLRSYCDSMKRNPTQTSAVFTEAFFQTKANLFANISSITGQDATDICYFLRVMNFYKKAGLTQHEKTMFLNQLDKLIERMELTPWQVFTIFSDLAQIKKNNSNLERAVVELLGNTEQAVHVLDLKLILQCLDVDHHLIYFRALRAIMFRLKLEDFRGLNNYNLIDVFDALVKHAAVYPYVHATVSRVMHLVAERLPTFNESDVIKLLNSYQTPDLTADALLAKVLDFVKDNLAARSSDDRGRSISPISYDVDDSLDPKSAILAKDERAPKDWSARFYGSTCNALIALKPLGKFVPEAFISALSESALQKFKQKPSACYDIVRVVELLAVYKPEHGAGRVSRLLELLPSAKQDEGGLSQFILVSALAEFQAVDGKGILSVEKLLSTFNILPAYTQVQALAVCAQNTLSAEWGGLLEELELRTVLLAESLPFNALSSSIARLANYPSVLYSTKLPKLKTALLKGIRANYAQTKKLALKSLLYLAPWNEAEVSQVIFSSEVTLPSFQWSLRELSRDFPLESLVSLLHNNPRLTTLKTVLTTTEFIKPHSNFTSVKHLAGMLSVLSDLEVGYSSHAIRLAKFVNELGGRASHRDFNAFFQKVNESYLSHDNYSEACVILAIGLKRVGKLQSELAVKIVNSQLPGGTWSKDDLMELATGVFQSLDTELVRRKLMEPALSASSIDKLKGV